MSDEQIKTGATVAKPKLMASLPVPKEHYQGFTTLMNLDDEQQEELLTVLRSVEATLRVKDLASQVSSQLPTIPQDDSKSIIRLIISIYRLRDSLKYPTDNLVTDLSNAVDMDKELSKPEKFNVGNFSVLLRQQYLKPGFSYAVSRAERLLIESSEIMDNIPLGDLFPDGDGGIRVEWSSPNHTITLMIPSHRSGQEYLYHGETDTYGAEYDVTPQMIATHLSHITDDEQSEQL